MPAICANFKRIYTEFESSLRWFAFYMVEVFKTFDPYCMTFPAIKI